MRRSRWVLCFVACLAGWSMEQVMGAQVETSLVEDFQSVEVTDDGTLDSAIGRFIVEGAGALQIAQPASWDEGALALRLPGGTNNATVLEVRSTLGFGGTLEFRCQKDGRKRPFALEVLLLDRDGGEVGHDLTGQVNAKEPSSISVEVPGGVTQVRFNVSAPAKRGVWIDDVRFVPPTPMRLESARLNLHTRPLIHGESVEVGVLELVTVGGLNPLRITAPVLEEHAAGEAEAPQLLSTFAVGTGDPELDLVAGLNRFPVYATVDLTPGESEAPEWSAAARYSLAFELSGEPMKVGLESMESFPVSWPAVRVMPADVEIEGVSLVAIVAREGRGEVLVAAVSTADGLVIKRSLDGGATWGPVELGPSAARLGSASLVYDIVRDRLHVLAERESGLVHASSEDQGATWSPWEALGNLGPLRIGGSASSGICMSTAELVVPCIYYGGFRIEDEPCAGLIVSGDGGKTWETHRAAYANTTTSTVVELGPGALLLNMNDRRGALRSERTTRDLGVTWVARRRVSKENLHRNAGADGAMIHLGRARGTGWDSRLVYANPSTDRRPVRNMTLKGSSDNTSSWPMEFRLLLDDGTGVDHPSLAPVGKSDVGVAYQPTAGGVIFQRLPEAVVVPRKPSMFDITGGR